MHQDDAYHGQYKTDLAAGCINLQHREKQCKTSLQVMVSLTVMTPWGRYLREQVLPSIGLSGQEAASRMGTSNTFLSACIHGRAQVPLDKITSWADALRLDGDARRQFCDLAALTQIRDVAIQQRIATALATTAALVQRLAIAEELQRRLEDVCRLIHPDGGRRVADGGQGGDAAHQA